MRTRVHVIAAVVLLAGAGCSGQSSSGNLPGGSPVPGLESATPAAATFLDGTWEASIPRQAYLRYLADHGVRRADAVDAAAVDHVGRDFSVRFADGLFNVTGPTGDSWHRGDFEVAGDELHLWDDGYREAGIPPFRLLMTRGEDEVRLAVAPGQERGPMHRRGVPELVAGGALWCVAPWRKVA